MSLSPTSIFTTLSSLPIYLTLPPPILLFFLAFYLALCPVFPTPKQQSYLISCCASGIMTLSSFYFVWVWATEGFEGLVMPPGDNPVFVPGVSRELLEWREGWAKVVSVFFGSYLAADLLFGAIFYPKHMGFLTGYVHHTVYIGVMAYLQIFPHASVFMLAAFMELPTFHLGLSTIAPKTFRNDPLFLTVFLLTRIIYHTYLIISFLTPPALVSMLPSVLTSILPFTPGKGLALLHGHYGPGILLAAAIPLHIMWFYGGVVGHLRRRSERKKAKDATAKAVAEEQGEAPAAPITEKSDPMETISSPIPIPTSPYSKSSSSSSRPSPFLSPYSHSLNSPPETPLLTPSSSFAQLGSPSYFLQGVQGLVNLPNLQLPSIPGINRKRPRARSSSSDEDDEDPAETREPTSVGSALGMPDMKMLRRRFSLRGKGSGEAAVRGEEGEEEEGDRGRLRRTFWEIVEGGKRRGREVLADYGGGGVPGLVHDREGEMGGN